MKTIILSIGVLALVANIILGIILSCYSPLNCVVTSAIIILNMVMLHFVSIITLKDGYRASLNVLFPIMFIIEMCLGVAAHDRVQDNYSLVVIILLLLLQACLLIVTNKVSKLID